MLPVVRRSLRAAPVRSLHTSAPRRGVLRTLWSTRVVRYPVYATASLTASVVAILGGLMIYDSMTYETASRHNLIPSMEASVKGGPEGLPILNTRKEEGLGKRKERLVILGGGWAAVALLSRIDRDAYDVVLVSPNNFFLFTPLLPSAAVGTVETRSIIESLRRLLSTVSGSYVQGSAQTLVQAADLDSKTLRETQAKGLVEVEVISGDGWDGDRPCNTKQARIYVPYDKLVIAVGSVTNNYGVKGLENCFRLKTIHDARDLRKRLMDNLEIAALPTLSEDERRRLLSVVVCGGGPTGVEAAAEVFDMIQEDVERFFPKELRKLASVHLLQDRAHILNTYSEAISNFAEQKFRRVGIDVTTNAIVDEVRTDSVVFKKNNPQTGEAEHHSIPSGCTIWSAGITMADFSRSLSKSLPKQGHPHALRVDEHLRVLGTPPGTVYALGDASTIDYDIAGALEHKLASFPGTELGYSDVSLIVASLRRKFPIAATHLSEMRRLFNEFDRDGNHRLSHDELREMVLSATRKMTSLPPTAQVASQEGKYLGRKLNKYAQRRDAGTLPSDGDIDDEVYRPFRYRGLGSVARL
ncbi:hypothetical protein MCUN1_003861 [Malassezia cuniculi]|uniref:EF-hand domain-containing protein n=1 Tax=Malassezia cuniculi TaxID=948313 RepID=A0AAF0EXG6_9BASI|nr:hypothetical protein MCUN1_003861 [Malassezia cuniculi]